MAFSELSPRQKAAVLVGILFVLTGSALWWDADKPNLPLSSSLMVLGIPLLCEMAGNRGARIRRTLSMLVPAGGGFWLGFQSRFLSRIDFTHLVALASDTYPLLLFLIVVLLAVPRTRLAAALVAAGFLAWFFGFGLGMRLGLPRIR